MAVAEKNAAEAAHVDSLAVIGVAGLEGSTLMHHGVQLSHQSHCLAVPTTVLRGPLPRR
jgi:hypothetical protein